MSFWDVMTLQVGLDVLLYFSDICLIQYTLNNPLGLKFYLCYLFVYLKNFFFGF